MSQMLDDDGAGTLRDLYSRELEVHDNTIQALYGIGLKLQYCIQLIDSTPEQVKAGLEGAIINLDEVVEELRSRIYELH